MAGRQKTVDLVERFVGAQWLITSPQVEGLFVAHADLDEARRAVPGAIEMLRRMTKRGTAKREEAAHATAG